MGFNNSKELDIDCTIDKFIINGKSPCRYTTSLKFDMIDFYDDHFLLGYTKIPYDHAQINEDHTIIYAKITETPENSILQYITFYTIKLNSRMSDLLQSNHFSKFNQSMLLSN